MRLKQPAKALGAMVLVAFLSDAQTASSSSPIYEDEEVRIVMPAGWVRASDNRPALEPYRGGEEVVAGNSVLQRDRRLLLQKGEFILALAYRTSHASGIAGGRFLEAFVIPWLDPDQASTCSLVLQTIPQPASRALLFNNILLDTSSADIRAKCAIPRDLSKWMYVGNEKTLVGERRWYGGYFTSNGGYFFDEGNESCESKLYSLTTLAKTPGQLPAAEDPHLARITQEAIDIVDSIEYKRCAPKPHPWLR